MQKNDRVEAMTRMQTMIAMPTAIPTPFEELEVCWPNGDASWDEIGVEGTGSVVGRNVDEAEDGVGVEVSTRICGAILFFYGFWCRS
jgi:hypothetical protein